MTTEHTHGGAETPPAQQTQQGEHVHESQATQQAQQTDAIETIIIFNGLLVFRPDRLNKICEVGVLHTRDHAQPHILQIEIEPDPHTGTGKLIIDPDLLERYVQGRNTRWTLDIVRNGLPVDPGIVVNSGIPSDRHEVQGSTLDFGWVVNVESGEFHAGPVTRTPGKLKPIIQLTNGKLFTICLTDSIDVKQGPNTRFDFGFIAAAIGLKLTPADGDMAILYFTDPQGRPTEIFRLPNINQVAYKVFIRNTPVTGPAGGHFHLFYDRLFQGVGGNQRFDLLPHYPPIPVDPSARCTADIDPEPDPFKCGGIAVGGSGPLD